MPGEVGVAVNDSEVQVTGQGVGPKNRRVREVEGEEGLTNAQSVDGKRLWAHHGTVYRCKMYGRVLGGTVLRRVQVVVGIKVNGCSDQVGDRHAEIHGGDVDEYLSAETAQLLEAQEGHDDEERADDGESA